MVSLFRCRSYDERLLTNETLECTIGSLTKTEDEQNEQELDTVDNFIELLVVHPEEMVEMETDIVPEMTRNDIFENNKSTALSSEKNPFKSSICLKKENLKTGDEIEEEESVRNEEMEKEGEEENVAAALIVMTTKTTASTKKVDEIKPEREEERTRTRKIAQAERNNYQINVADEFTIKEEPEDNMLFCDSYIAEDDQVVELQEQHVTWMYDNKEATNDECGIVYKCGLCANTYESETSFQSHVCGNVKKSKNFFHCELCDRVFKSEFVFKLHYGQHKKSTQCQLCNICFLDAEDLLNHLNQVHPYVRNADPDDLYEEVIAGSEKQCDVCGKITDNLKQHRLYHAIKELEHCKAENKKFLKKWFYCQVNVILFTFVQVICNLGG